MSDFENPYQSPEAPVVPEVSKSSSGLSETMLRYLKEASPWLRFVGIIGFISCGFIALMGLIIVIIFAVGSSMFSEAFEEFGAYGGLVGLLFFVVFLGLAALCFFPSLFTYRFGKKIRDHQYTNSIEDLELAFRNNKSLWKFTGILVIVSLASNPIAMIIAGVVAGVAATSF